jgi:hypothetical protein
MFQFAGFASYSYVFTIRYRTSAVGCPIRKSPDQSLLATPQGLSQRATSFIASTRQGIHQMPLSRLNLNESVMRRDQSDARHVYRVNTNILDPEGLVNNLSVVHSREVFVTQQIIQTHRTRQSRRIGVGVLHSRIHDDKERNPMRTQFIRNRKIQRSGSNIIEEGEDQYKSTLVEVNGIEPMTSCLQSRRSPN